MRDTIQSALPGLSHVNLQDCMSNSHMRQLRLRELCSLPQGRMPGVWAHLPLESMVSPFEMDESWADDLEASETFFSMKIRARWEQDPSDSIYFVLWNLVKVLALTHQRKKGRNFAALPELFPLVVLRDVFCPGVLSKHAQWQATRRLTSGCRQRSSLYHHMYGSTECQRLKRSDMGKQVTQRRPLGM